MAHSKTNAFHIRSIIGISGRMRSGKDTLAYRLGGEDGIDKRYRVVSIAEEAKRDIANSLGVSRAELDDRKDLYRTLMQVYMNTARERFGTGYWAQRLIDYCKTNMLTHIVIKDVKTSGDILVLSNASLQKHFIRLKASDAVIKQRSEIVDGYIPTSTQLQHRSELELEPGSDWWKAWNPENKFRFDQTIDTSNTPATTVAQYVQNELEPSSFDFFGTNMYYSPAEEFKKPASMEAQPKC